MKKSIFFLCVIFAFFWVVGVAGAEGINKISYDKTTIINHQKSKQLCDQNNFMKVANESGNTDLPYFLQADQKACLDNCSQEYDSCMSEAGDSATAKFRCQDKRRICSLGCDNQWYQKLRF